MPLAWPLRALAWLGRLARGPGAWIGARVRGRPALLVGLGLALIAALFLAWRAQTIAAQRDQARTEARELAAALADRDADLALRNLAEQERLADDRAIAALERELTDAIADQEDMAPGPMRVALGCVRLQRAGIPLAQLPLPCRSGD